MSSEPENYEDYELPTNEEELNIEEFRDRNGFLLTKADLANIPENIDSEEEILEAVQINLNIEFSENGALYFQLKELFTDVNDKYLKIKTNNDDLKNIILILLANTQDYIVLDVQGSDKRNKYINLSAIFAEQIIANGNKTKNFIEKSIKTAIMNKGLYPHVYSKFDKSNKGVIIMPSVTNFATLIEYIQKNVPIFVSALISETTHRNKTFIELPKETQLYILEICNKKSDIFLILLYGTYEDFINTVYNSVVNMDTQGNMFKLDQPSLKKQINEKIKRIISVVEGVSLYSLERISKNLLEERRIYEAEDLKKKQAASDVAFAELMAEEESKALSKKKKKQPKQPSKRSVSVPIPSATSIEKNKILPIVSPEPPIRPVSAPTLTMTPLSTTIDLTGCKTYSPWNLLCGSTKKFKKFNNGFDRWFRVIEQINYWTNPQSPPSIPASINDLYVSLMAYIEVTMNERKSVNFAIKGGCIRDIILSQLINDIDISVYNDTPAELEEFTKILGELLTTWSNTINPDFTVSYSPSPDPKLFNYVILTDKGEELKIDIASKKAFYTGTLTLPASLSAFDFDINQLKIDLSNKASGYLGLTLNVDEKEYLGVSLRSVLENLINRQAMILKPPMELFKSGTFNQITKIMDKVDRYRMTIIFPKYVVDKYGQTLVNRMKAYIYTMAFQRREESRIGNQQVINEKQQLSQQFTMSEIKDYDEVASLIKVVKGGRKRNTVKRRKKKPPFKKTLRKKKRCNK